MGYRLGIDVGTTFTAAAVLDGHAQMLGLGNRALQVPTVLFFKQDGEVLVGEAAEARGALEPGRLVREFKRRIGDPVPILVAGSPQSPQSLLARMLTWVVASATTSQGAPPDHVTVTHPANWGPYKLDLFRQALRLAELGAATTLTEPAAAAVSYASRNRMSDGDVVVVYDLGGGTFDVAALRRSGDAFEALGQPEGIDHLGGIDFDEAVFRHVLAGLASEVSELDPEEPDVRLAIARLRRDCVLGKEALSSDTETLIPVTMPGVTRSVRLTRSEFEEMVAPTLEDTLGAVRRAMASAKLGAEDVSAFVLVGGSSRIPLVSERLVAEFGRPVAMDTHPKHEIALGAAITTLPLAEPRTTEPVTEEIGPVTESPPGRQEPVKPQKARKPPRERTAAGRGLLALPRRTLLIGAGVVASVIIAVVAANALGGGGGSDHAGDNPSDTPSVATTTPSSPASLDPGSWQGVHALPVGMVLPSVVAFGNRLVVATGGLPDGTNSKVQQIYDPATNTWSHKPGPKHALDHAAAATDGSTIYVLGGAYLDSKAKVVTAEVWQEDGPSGKWKPAPALPQPRSGGAAAWDGKSLYYAGGVDKNLKARSEVWRLDGNRWVLVTGRLSIPRTTLAAASDGDGTIWFIGGRSSKTIPAKDVSYANVDVVTSGRVTRGQRLPVPLRLTTAAYVSGAGPCVFGGYTTENVADVRCLGPKGWVAPLPVLLAARYGSGAGIVGGDAVYVVGGTTVPGGALPQTYALPLHGRALPGSTPTGTATP
ncbi:Hsp70 family protein [Angustibacter sp. McL0619]|uniref:Hsp70 family protein n=1 Tax=Angustibacter sp. McL0619 TaxID=3415676 RepID=UPI003CF0C18D